MKTEKPLKAIADSGGPGGEGVGLTIAEKSAKAKREFWKRVERLIKDLGKSNAFFQEIVEKAAMEYLGIFGRIGVNPLKHLKGGVMRPRYLVDRDELWVLYKPAMWQMGGSIPKWTERLADLTRRNKAVNVCQEILMKSDEKSEMVQTWHGLAQGLKWLPPAEVEQMQLSQWGFIQRLDLETDGPVVIAKTWRAQRYLQMQMREHIFNKGYMCLVHGRVENAAHFFKGKFAEMGSDTNTQIMLKHDIENDPFYELGEQGRMNRHTRQAETFYKPIAYYRRKEDNSEYSLVYVNILSGITHQIRITMQANGHPLVSDDRYLPREQARKDLTWCPRNFLTEVRSDFFDFNGPNEDYGRKRLTRMSIENPLPQLMQDILDKKLQLVEKLDPAADLYVGCQYWAIGDEQLMNAHPKDMEFRQKVMRWGQRRGIHLDALDRLLLLPKDEVDGILQEYVPPGDKGNKGWVCNECMMYNAPDWHGDVLQCRGGAGQGMECKGSRMLNEGQDAKLPAGWLDYTSDPTFHLMLTVHKAWLEARRKILYHARPSWERPPVEPEGTMADEDMMESLKSALVLKAKEGVYGISEQELKSIGGLRDIKLPLQVPDDGVIRRCRLPGKGSLSQWTYALKGKELLKYSSTLDLKTKKLSAPVTVEADEMARSRIISKAEIEASRKKREKEERLEAKRKLQALEDDQEKSWWTYEDSAPVAKKQKSDTDTWEQRESSSKPGHIYWYNTETGESRTKREDAPSANADRPDRWGPWRRVESKSNPGTWYYSNVETNESRMDPPSGWGGPYPPAKVARKEPEAPRKEPEDEGIPWKRMESSSKPGQFYYFNPTTGDSEVHPPRVSPPWQLLESRTKKGQFYYNNTQTGEQTVDPPKSARAASASTKLQGDRSGRGPAAEESAAPAADLMPAGWEKKESEKHKGKFYYLNTRTGETTWTAPAADKWERVESSSAPGKFYWRNLITGETSWTSPGTSAK